jgi:hypothetical protein
MHGLAEGQRVDNDVYQFVRHKRPLKTAGGKSVIAALRNKGMLIVRAQVRANCRPSELTTLVDLVCVKMYDKSMWAVEIKNTTMPLKGHQASFRRADPYNPRMKNEMAHTDCNSYMLQAAFGALALNETYSALPAPIRALLVVATADSGITAQVYEVPDHYLRWAHFKRRPPVPLRLQTKAAPKGKRCKGKGSGDANRAGKAVARVPLVSLAWPAKPAAADKALRRMDLVRMGVTRKNKVVYPVSRVSAPGVPAAIAICLPSRMAKCKQADAKRAMQLLVSSAKREMRKFSAVSSLSLVGVALDTMAVSSCGAPLSRGESGLL